MNERVDLKDVPYLLLEHQVISESPDYYECRDRYGYQDYEESVSSFQTDRFYVGLARSDTPAPLMVRMEQTGPYLEMNFTFSGASAIHLDQKFELEMTGGRQALFALPDMKGELTLSTRNALGIHLSAGFIRDTFGDELPVLAGFIKDIEKGRPAVLGKESLPIPAATHSLLYDLLNCPYTGILKKAYYEAKITELLTVHIDLVQKSINPAAPGIGLSKDDISKLYYARELLVQQMDKPCTIMALSRMVGMNDYKLKLGFRQLFGTTIFTYFSDMRMTKAKSLLSEPDLTVAEVAYAIGYKNPQHFSSAFKKKFGILPSQMRR